jgi:hypothetical protein
MEDGNLENDNWENRLLQKLETVRPRKYITKKKKECT